LLVGHYMSNEFVILLEKRLWKTLIYQGLFFTKFRWRETIPSSFSVLP
jgi:hypothetical protein